jgi:hypothetical protein
MLKLISDQNFSGPVLRGIFRRVPDVDILRALDVGLDRASDPDVLAWAASEDRILMTHDVNTIPAFAYERVRANLDMPGVFLVPARMAVGRAIDDLVAVITCSSPEEWKDTVTYFPF